MIEHEPQKYILFWFNHIHTFSLKRLPLLPQLMPQLNMLGKVLYRKLPLYQLHQKKDTLQKLPTSP